MGLPSFRSRTDEFHHTFVFALGHSSPGQVFAIGLIDHNGVGQFHNTLFDTLQIVACAGENYQHKEINHIADGGLRLAYTDGFHQNHIIACRFAEHHGLAALAGHAAQGPAGRRRTDKAVGFPGQVLHTGLIAQNGTARQRAGRIHCQNGHFIAHAAQQLAKGFNKRTFTRAGHAGDADTQRPAGFRQQSLQYPLGFVKIFGRVTFNQCNRLG